MKRKDLTNKTFTRLYVLTYAFSKNGRAFWHCKCDCGNEKDISAKELLRGTTRSCGCLRSEVASKSMKKHGATDTRLYHIWCSMKQRCENPTSEKHLRDYKKRGITICKEWHDFINFQNWALTCGYDDALSIDRIDNNGNYCPENCRWVDNITQANNKRNNVRLTYNNKTQTIAQWAKELGMKYNALDERLRKGWSIEKALTRSLCKRG